MTDIGWHRKRGEIYPPCRLPLELASNFVNAPSEALWDILTQAVCLTVVTLLVAMRLYTKIKALRNPSWDDCKLHILHTAKFQC